MCGLAGQVQSMFSAVLVMRCGLASPGNRYDTCTCSHMSLHAPTTTHHLPRMPMPMMCDELCCSPTAHSPFPSHRRGVSSGMVLMRWSYAMMWPLCSVTVLASLFRVATRCLYACTHTNTHDHITGFSSGYALSCTRNTCLDQALACTDEHAISMHARRMHMVINYPVQDSSDMQLRF